MRKVPVDEAVGLVLGHDITKIIPGQEKKRAFKRGDIIKATDIEPLKNLGKEHIYIWEEEDDKKLVHENDAGLFLAKIASGEGINIGQPNQGRVPLTANQGGLLKVDKERLFRLNDLEDIVFSTLHNNWVVEKGQVLAGTRIIPLAIKRELLAEAEKIVESEKEPLIHVKPFKSMWVALVTTGNEVYSERIKDGSKNLITKKIAPFGGKFLGQTIVPDNKDIIASEIENFLQEGAEIVFVSGGMSVDPDDVSPSAIRSLEGEVVLYGTPVLPGSMFMLAYKGKVPICGLPGCIMYNKQTILDLLLPRLFAGEKIRRSEVIALGHGGMCQDCEVCHYPNCSFGKA